MATFSPFAASQGSTQGNTVKITADATPASVAGSLNCANILATSILVTNAGTVLVFVRMSPEATPTATNKDIPLPAGASRVLENPVQNFGTVGLAVLSSTTTACDVYFTPGTGATQ